MPQHVRVFISSPGDVPDERLRADLIIEKLSQDYTRFFTIEPYRWETEPMLASGHFQDAIEPPSAFDIVVLILWSRLGTPLPERTALREYRGIDGRAPVTGAEWEYEEALRVARETGAPDLLAFRNVSPAPIDTRDPAARAAINAQLDALDQFWRRHFADKGMFLAAYDEYRTLEDFAHRLEESLRKLIERRIKSVVTETAAPIWLGEPFRGLESYEFEHAPVFFGRDAAIAKATRQLAANARACHAFLLVSGPSGSGKSSLVKAGIVPRLMKPQRISGAAFVRRVVFRPASEESNVFLGLTHALLRASGDDSVGLRELIGPGQNAEQLAAFLRHADAPGFLFGNALGHLTELGRQSGRMLAFEDAKLILVVDQLEELFTRPEIAREDRTLFINLLDGLARSGAVWVIATLRDDFWHRAVEIPELRMLAEGEGRIDLAAPSPAELAEMIRKPAQVAGLTFEVHGESGLSLDAVLAEHASAAPGALPLLSFTLDELYKDAKVRGEAVLGYASYEALGGLQGAIAKRADETLGSLPAATQQSLPRVLRALTTISGTADQAPVAQPAPLTSLGEATPARALVDAFVAARLLVAASEVDASATVRLAHEALITRWQRARHIIVENADFYRIRADIEEQRRRFEEGRKRSELLLRGRPLAEAEDIVKKHSGELSPQTLEYVRVSRQRANRSKIIAWSTAAVFAFLAVGMLGLAKFAFDQMTVAQGREKLVRSQSLLAQGKVAQAIQNGLAAYDLLPSEPTRSNLIAALGRLSPYSLGALDSPADMPGPVAWNSDNALAVAMRSGELRSLAIAGASGEPSHQPSWMVSTQPDIEKAGAVAISLRRLSDGDIVIAYSDGSIGILRAHAAKAVFQEPGNSDQIYSFAHATAISQSGSLVVMASIGSGIVSYHCDWQTTAPNPCTLFHLPLPQSGDFRAVAISRDERLVAVGDRAGNVSVCDSTSCHATAAPLTDAISALAWSDNSSALAAGTISGEVVVIDSHSLMQLGRSLSKKPVTTIAWRPMRSEFASACGGSVICLWDMPNGSQAKAGLRLVARFVGHSGTILRVSWSPNGSTLASISDDSEIRAWSINQNTKVMYELSQCGSTELNTLTVSSNLSQIAAAGTDGLTCVWSAVNGQLIKTLSDSHHSAVESLAWSKSGSLAMLHQSGAIEVWSNDFRQNQFFPPLPIEPFSRIIWSSDDRLLIVTASQGQVAILDSTNPSKPPTFSKYIPRADGASGLAVRQSDDALFVSYPHTIGMVNLHSNAVLGEIPAAPSFSGSLSFSQDERFLAATGSDGFVDIYEIATKSIWRKVPVDVMETMTVAFSPDDRRLAVLGSGKGVIDIFDVSADNPILLEALDLGASAILNTGLPDAQRVNWIGWLAADKLAAASSDGKVIVVSLDEKSWKSRIREVGLVSAN